MRFARKARAGNLNMAPNAARTSLDVRATAGTAPVCGDINYAV
jgi:hypothetical protein